MCNTLFIYLSILFYLLQVYAPIVIFNVISYKYHENTLSFPSSVKAIVTDCGIWIQITGYFT